MSKVYMGVPGTRTKMGGFPVYVYPDAENMDENQKKELDPRPSQKLVNHSPNGFNWGYAGSGPSQCALGILFDVTGDADMAMRRYQDFKWDVIEKQPEDKKWFITEYFVNQWLDEKKEAEASQDFRQ